MKKGHTKQHLKIVLLITFAFFLTTCRQDNFFEDFNHPIVSIRIAPDNLTVSVGQTIQLNAIALYVDNIEEDITGSVTWNQTGTGTLMTTGTPGEFTATAVGTMLVSASRGAISSTTTGSDSTIAISITDIFVSPLGNDLAGWGTSMYPFATVDHAMSIAAAGMNIRIAAGNYLTTQISLIEGVSLYGGYSPTNWSRNIATNITTITDSSTVGGVPGPNIPKATIDAGAAITTATVLDGLVIQGSTNPGMTIAGAINITGGSPVITACTLYGGFGTSMSYGIKISGGNPQITYSNIDGGSSASSVGVSINGSTTSMILSNTHINAGSGSSSNIALFVGNSAGSPLIYNNVVTSGSSATNSSIALAVSQSSNPLITNNTFSTGNCTGTASGVSLEFGAKARLLNNIFILPSGTFRYGIRENYAGDDPQEVRYNIFYNATVIYHDFDIPADWTLISQMETLVNGGTIASNNIDGNPLIAGGGDYHLTLGSPAISAGLNGIDEGWAFFPTDAVNPIDYEMNVRPGGGGGFWCIGAYEY
jgi:hypothetical protein